VDDWLWEGRLVGDDLTRYVLECPLDECDWKLDTTPPDVPMTALGTIFGVGTLAAAAQFQHRSTLEAEIETHLRQHPLLDFIRTVGRQRERIAELALQLADLRQTARERAQGRSRGPFVNEMHLDNPHPQGW
jgi:hypothetical protein